MVTVETRLVLDIKKELYIFFSSQGLMRIKHFGSLNPEVIVVRW